MPFSDWIQTLTSDGRKDGARHSHAQVHVHAVFEFLGRAAGNAVPSDKSLGFGIGFRRCRCLGFVAAVITARSGLFDFEFLLDGRWNDAIDENAGKMDVVRIDRADRHNVFGLHNCKAGGLCHDRPEGFGRVSSHTSAVHLVARDLLAHLN